MTASTATGTAEAFAGSGGGGPPFLPYVGRLAGRRRRWLGSDAVVGFFVRVGAYAVLLMLASLVGVLLYAAAPSMKTFGGKFLVTKTWRPNELETFKRDALGKLIK